MLTKSNNLSGKHYYSEYYQQEFFAMVAIPTIGVTNLCYESLENAFFK